MANASIHSDFAVDSTGHPLNGGTVAVYAVDSAGNVSGTPASLYSDVALTNAIANPAPIDSLGNYAFYTAPGLYSLVVTSSSGQTKSYREVFPAAVTNQVRYTTQFSSGSTTGGIAEAYADCPSTGGMVVLGEDITITSPQTITLASGKPLTLEMAGRTITVNHSSGVGLTFTSTNFSRDPLRIQNGVLKGTFSASGLTAFKFSAISNVSLENLNVLNVTATNSVAMLWDDVEDSCMNAVGFVNNNLAFQAQNATNQNQISNCWFDANVTAVVVKDAGGITFADCLIQSNTAQHAFQALTTTGNNATALRIAGCHFENNGDGTAASRAVYIAPASAQVYLEVLIQNNIFSQGAFAPGSTAVEIAGSQSVEFLTRLNNQYNGYLSTQHITGLVAGNLSTTVGEYGTGSSDVALNPALGSYGLVFSPVGAAREYQVYAGYPGQFDGFLQFWNTTNNESILNYSGPSQFWTFPKQANFSANVIVGSSGTQISQIRVYTPSLTPAAVAANTSVIQTFTVTGLTTADIVTVNPVSALGAGLAIGAVFVSSADTLAILFVNVTAGSLTPVTSATYRILAVRS